MKVSPEAVDRGPPMLGTPLINQIGKGARSRVVPSGTCQSKSPLARSMPASVPQGGGEQGISSGEKNPTQRRLQ